MAEFKRFSDGIEIEDPNITYGGSPSYNRTAIANAEKMYGSTQEQTGQMNKNVIKMREDALNQEDPASTELKNQANVRMRSANASKASTGSGGLSVGEREQIKRSSEADIAQQQFANQKDALNSYSRMANNIVSNTLGAAYGQQALNTQLPSTSSGTVICTELYRQGFISDEVFALDTNFGVELRRTSPHVYIGYLLWAIHIVKLMKASKIFTKIVSLIAVPWSLNMAYGNNKFGLIVNKIGMPICGLIGKVFGGCYAKYEI